jgi:sugar lactone lactonase YvrE
MMAMEVLLTGFGIPESPRWRDGRLWFCDWGRAEVRSLGPGGNSRLELSVPTSLPFSIDWLPDGRLLVVSGPEGLLLRREPDGTLVTHADLRALGAVFNELVVDARGNAYVNGAGLVLATADGTARLVAEGLAFGNGMAITPDGSTLIVAESHGQRLTAFDIEPDGGLSGRRIWADLGDAPPDGICLDAEGACWYADVPHRRCVRVREGGEVLETIDADRGCFACMLGGDDGRTLYVTTAEWRGMDRIPEIAGTGRVQAARVEVPHAGRP